MKRLTLREITDKIFFDKKLANGGTATGDALKNFYISQFKNFKQIIHIIDLDDEIEYLKQSDSYSFAEVDVEFWIEMLMEFTGKYVPLRRADFKAAENAFIVRIYEGVIDTFRNCDVSAEVLQQVAYKMNNRLNYPVCKQCTIIENMQNRWNELIRKRLDTFSLSIRELERCQWLIAMESDFQLFIEKWDDLFGIMKELRSEELNNKAEQESRDMSKDECLAAEVDWAIVERFYDLVMEDERYQKLLSEYNGILGRPKERKIPRSEIRDILNKGDDEKVIPNKKPFVDKKLENRFAEVSKKLGERYEELRQSVIKEMFPDIFNRIIAVESKEQEMDFSFLMPVDELLKKAMDEQKEDWEFNIKMNCSQHIELPQIDIEKLNKQLEKFSGL